MKYYYFLFLFLTITISGITQNKIDWDENYQLQLSDFQSPSSSIGNGYKYSVNSTAIIAFGYNMSAGEFMFTKNFNDLVDCYVTPTSAYIIAPDSTIAEQVLNYARFEFDLAELYARKLRKKLYEEKGTFSSSDFFQPVFDTIMSEFRESQSHAAIQTDLGRNEEILKMLHEAVLKEIAELNSYCRACKPQKKKKKRE